MADNDYENIYTQNCPDLEPDEYWRTHFEHKLEIGEFEYVLEALNALHSTKKEGLNFLEIHFLEQVIDSVDDISDSYEALQSEYIFDKDDDIFWLG